MSLLHPLSRLRGQAPSGRGRRLLLVFARVGIYFPELLRNPAMLVQRSTRLPLQTFRPPSPRRRTFTHTTAPRQDVHQAAPGFTGDEASGSLGLPPRVPPQPPPALGGIILGDLLVPAGVLMNHPKSLRVQGLSRLRPPPVRRFRAPSPPNPMLEKRLPCAHSVHAGAAAMQQLPRLSGIILRTFSSPQPAPTLHWMRRLKMHSSSVGSS